MRFIKMHGLGNDYVYIDCFNNPVPMDPSALSVQVSKHHFSIGSDGLILIEPSGAADASMRIFNADGSEAEMCGNGIRCVAKYVYDTGICKKADLQIETKSGIKRVGLVIENGAAVAARVDMGEPKLGFVNEHVRALGEDVALTTVDMGNPHAVVFVDELPGDGRFFRLGSGIEYHQLFPKRINVEFVKVVARDVLEVRVWERGSGETLACGTGACASLVAAVANGLCDRKAKVSLKGGDLVIEWNEDDRHVYMEGPATIAFTGELDA